MEKSKLVTLAPEIQGRGGIAGLGTALKAVQAVLNPYTGKYHGSVSFKELTRSLEAAKQQLAVMATPRADGLGRPVHDPRLEPRSTLDIIGNPNYVQDRMAMYQGQLSALNSLKLTAENYVQEDSQFLRSYEMFQDKWDAKFRADYRNPRIAEETRTAEAEGKNAYLKAVNLNQQQQLTIPQESPAVNPKTVGTGLSNSKGGITPFGIIESGLNI